MSPLKQFRVKTNRTSFLRRNRTFVTDNTELKHEDMQLDDMKNKNPTKNVTCITVSFLKVQIRI